MTRTGVDIIIPVYNALDELKDCVESVRKYTDLTLDRLIMIDDCSPDPAVYSWMKAQETAGVVILRNERNLGFSGTVNRGMQTSDRDVILLNSDTIVTKAWVDKMVRCALSDTDIATVTPFSNAATLCSIPQFCQDNQIPHQLTPDAYAEIVEKVSIRRYPRLTVGVGFCIYIRRRVIEEIGLFDAKTFQRGYGEENDFCWRASEMGYTHRLCDDTFIYHKGSASFENINKQDLIREHRAVVRERYPLLDQANDAFVETDRNADLRQTIGLFTALQEKKKTLLLILHHDYHQDDTLIGGTELHVSDLEEAFQHAYHVLVAARDEDSLVVTCTTDGERFTLRYPLEERSPYFAFSSGQLKRIWTEIIETFGVGLVHVHHLQGLSMDIYDVCKEKHIPVMTSLHDFYSVCPTIKLLNAENQYCEEIANPEMCETCLRRRSVIAQLPNYLQVWRREWSRRLNESFAVVVPSESTREIISSYYPDEKDRIRVIQHGSGSLQRTADEMGTDEAAFHQVACSARIQFAEDNYAEVFCEVCHDDMKQMEGFVLSFPSRDGQLLVPCVLESQKSVRAVVRSRLPLAYLDKGKKQFQLLAKIGDRWVTAAHGVLRVDGSHLPIREKLNVAALGGMSEEKGSELFAEAIMKSPSDIHWFLFGSTNDERLIQLRQKNLYISGPYRRENVGIYLRQYQIDVVCILSICPETFSYTLSEAWKAGIPVIAVNLGAVGERVLHEKGGWLLPRACTALDLLSLVQDLSLHPDKLKEKKQQIASLHLRSTEEMVSEYAELYEKYALEGKADLNRAPQICAYMQRPDHTYQGKEGLIRSMRQILDAREEELRVIKATKGYRALVWARHIYLHILGKE